MNQFSAACAASSRGSRFDSGRCVRPAVLNAGGAFFFGCDAAMVAGRSRFAAYRLRKA